MTTLIGTCPTCGPVTLTRDTAGGWAGRYCCGKWVTYSPVTVTKGKRACGGWCTDATSRTCTCECEGRNHGSRYAASGALWQSH